MAGNAGWRAPSYGSVRSIVGGINPAMATLAHEGAAAFRDKYELVHRRRAAKPNATWQADHTQLDILILDASGKEARPWLTTVVDDHSRAVAGYMVMLGAPSALRAVSARCESIRDSHRCADLIQGAGWMEVGMDGQAIINGSAFAGIGRG